ncbi:PTS system transporter subunit IIA [Streptococcus pneumoniae]|nr:PTS system transporter subunit IIA [Streptococcus pneumoniae]
MVLDYFFDKNLVFCLEADNQEQLFDQVATLLEEREIVTPTYREALITREKSFPTGLDMEFLGKDLPNVAIPHTDIVHNLAEKVVVVRLEKPVTFHNMIAPDKEVEVSLLFFIINNSSSSQTNILAQLMDFFTGNGHLEDLSKISEPLSALSFTRTLPTNVGNSSLINSRKSSLANNLKFQSKRLLDTRLSLVLISRPFVRTYLLNVMVVTFLVSVNSLKNKKLVRNA